MARQLMYPGFYPDSGFMTTKAAAWAFLSMNWKRAPEMVLIWFENEVMRVENANMAAKPKNKAGSGQQSKAEWTGFANIQLSAEDKAAIRGGVLDGETTLDILSEILSTGHKVSFTYDRDKDTVAGAITGVFTHCKNAGLTCTSFARNLPDCLVVMAYKHEVIAKGDWTKFVSQRHDPDDLG